MSRPYSAALPIAFVVLRLLVLFNLFVGAAIIALLLVVPHEQWILSEFRLSPSPEADRIVLGLRLVALTGLASIPVNHVILKRLLAMVETVRVGDPFVAANARRLHQIGWALVALQVLGLAVWALSRIFSTPDHQINLDAGFSINGWLAVLLTFVLARVFAVGTVMREDLEGTI